MILILEILKEHFQQPVETNSCLLFPSFFGISQFEINFGFFLNFNYKLLHYDAYLLKQPFYFTKGIIPVLFQLTNFFNAVFFGNKARSQNTKMKQLLKVLSFRRVNLKNGYCVSCSIIVINIFFLQVLKSKFGKTNNVTAGAAFKSQSKRELMNVKDLGRNPAPGMYNRSLSLSLWIL